MDPVEIRKCFKEWSGFSLLVILTSLEEWLVIYYNTGEKDILFVTIPVSTMIFVFGLNRTMNRDLGEFLLTMVTTLIVALVLVLVSKKSQLVKLIL